MKLTFHTLDVFTTRKFGGNPLAVVLGADKLTTEQMQTITREFNLSETTFVMAAENTGHTAKLRIFNPAHEMAFAGHPVLGTAVLLAALKNKPGCSFETLVKLELKAGMTPVRVSRIADRSFAVLTAPVLPSIEKAPTQPDEVALALNIAPAELGFDNHQVVVTRGGLGFLCVPVKSRDALAQARVQEPHWSSIIAKIPGVDAAYIYTRGGERSDAAYRARMFAPTVGMPEDPATGSATVQFAAQLLTSEKLSDGKHVWQLEQGYEMGRPSDLTLEADVLAGKLAAVRVGGSAVHMMSGELEL